MNPVLLVIVPGFLGGLLIASVVVLIHRRAERVSLVVPRRLPVTTDVINMASIKVAGVGGLGLVAMVVAVAMGVRQIGEAMAVSLTLGVAFAAILIVRRRKTGPLPSGDQGFGANTVLAIDDPPRPSSNDSQSRPLSFQEPFAPAVRS
jgi:hypothetical protein